MTDDSSLALDARELVYHYGQHRALAGLNLQVEAGQIFTLLGPNGSGKTTLFRLISTLSKIQGGDILVFGNSVKSTTATVRGLLGVVFQSPSLDPKLTVSENIDCQAALYGISGSELKQRKSFVCEQLGLQDRLQTRTEQLSGGLKRRAELAKVLVHRPRLLLMDEPSTGLDPASRLDLWHALTALKESAEVSVLLTTHLLEEAEKADRVAIMDQGRLVALGRPHELRNSLGEQVLSIRTGESAVVSEWLAERGATAQKADGQLRVSGSDAAQYVAPLADQFGSRIQSLTLAQPSLEDVFVARTGHRFLAPAARPDAKNKRKARK